MREKALRFIAITYSSDITPRICIDAIERKFGEVVFASLPYDFSSYTDYYENEMGKNLMKVMIILRGLFNQNDLHNFKKDAMALEAKFKEKGSRRLNIDPGYITPSKLVLSTHKEYSPAIAIGEDINAIVELVYHKGSFEPLMWTYRDYVDKISFFNITRKFLGLWI
ncbi:MAG: DUF4416 family protein [bacterium]